MSSTIKTTLIVVGALAVLYAGWRYYQYSSAPGQMRSACAQQLEVLPDGPAKEAALKTCECTATAVAETLTYADFLLNREEEVLQKLGPAMRKCARS